MPSSSAPSDSRASRTTSLSGISCSGSATISTSTSISARFQIVVTSNLFGDILTDLGAAIAGGMGLAAGANLNPDRKFPSMFEPIHGSAPDIAGQGIANPLAAIWSASQLLDFFGYENWGARVIDAIEEILTEGVHVTPDQGGNASTSECGGAVAEIVTYSHHCYEVGASCSTTLKG